MVLEIDDVDLHLGLLVVKTLDLSRIVSMNILRPHNALLFANENAPIQFQNLSCFLCSEQRIGHVSDIYNLQLTECAVSEFVIKPCFAAIIQVRAPRALQTTAHIAVEPLLFALNDLCVADFPSVCATVDDLV